MGIVNKILLKTLAFVVVIWFGFSFVMGFSALPLGGLIILICYNQTIHHYIIPYSDEIIYSIIPTLCCPFACYFIAKIFGIYRFIDNLKNSIFVKFLVLGLVTLFAYSILYLKITKVDSYAPLLPLALGFIPGYFLYKFFGFLTKKYPVPFERIGWWSSIEFWGGLMRKCWGRIGFKR